MFQTRNSTGSGASGLQQQQQQQQHWGSFTSSSASGFAELWSIHGRSDSVDVDYDAAHAAQQCCTNSRTTHAL